MHAAAGRRNIQNGGFHSNFAPVDEIGEMTQILEIEGEIPSDFPEGVYIRNGGNPAFGALHSVSSIFGQSHDIWVQGEGMIHAVYFTKSSNSSGWSISYNNRYVQSDTFRLEKGLQKPRFLPSVDGDPLAMLIATLLNTLRFGKVLRNMSNTSVFEHAGRVFTATENDNPHEIDLHSLNTLGSWDLGGRWNLPFTAHPKVVVRGFHLPTSVFLGPRLENMTMDSSNKGPNEEFFSRLYEWRLNMKTRAAAGKYLTGIEVALEFPVMNDRYAGQHHRYAYAQLADPSASFAGGHGIVRPKFGGFVKLCLEEKESITTKQTDRKDLIRMEYHHLDRNQFCSGVSFVPKVNGAREDDGWIISFVHDEGTNVSKVNIIDTQRFESGPIAKITLPQRVPYGFHGAFISKRT